MHFRQAKAGYRMRWYQMANRDPSLPVHNSSVRVLRVLALDLLENSNIESKIFISCPLFVFLFV
jgi:hypothetical protein